MKRIFATGLLLSIFLTDCHNGKNPPPQAGGDTIDVEKSDSLARDTTRKETGDHGLKDKIIGIWAAVGDENATFVIDQKKITYPDQDKKYSYVLLGDSIHIKFDGYDGNYLVSTRGSDTLVLKGDDEQVYYRFKR